MTVARSPDGKCSVDSALWRNAGRVRPHGDHVFCNLPSRAHSRVKALGNDAGESVVGDELYLNLGISPEGTA